MSRPLSRRTVLRLCAPLAGIAAAGCSGDRSAPSGSTTTTRTTQSPTRSVVGVNRGDVHVEGWSLEWHDTDPVVRGRVVNGTSDYVLYLELRIVLVDDAGTRRYAGSGQVLGITPGGTELFSVRLHDAGVDPDTVTGYRLAIVTLHFE